MSIWWAKHRSMVPANVWIALGAAAVAAGVFIVVGPLNDPSKVYAIAAQIMPAFLIAVAVEHSAFAAGSPGLPSRTAADQSIAPAALSFCNSAA
jgi:hypothetical protein